VLDKDQMQHWAESCLKSSGLIVFLKRRKTYMCIRCQ